VLAALYAKTKTRENAEPAITGAVVLTPDREAEEESGAQFI
jgi:hypothetical protein